MAGTAYHMEALRRQRVLERKAEAMKRLEDTIAQPTEAAELARDLKQTQLVFSEPGQYAQNRLTYYKIGPERDRRQYDHSRDGPIVDRTRYELKREFNFLGQSLGMVKSDIRSLKLASPVCRRF